MAESTKPHNIKYVSGVSQYNISPLDDIINVDTSIPVLLVLPNIVGSGLNLNPKHFYINDYTGQAATNNITVIASGNAVNSGNAVVLNTAYVSADCVIVGQDEYLIVRDDVTSGGTGGTSYFINPNPTTISVGGYPAGTTFPVQQTMQQMWDNLLYPYQNPAFTSFLIGGQETLIEVGVALAGVKTFNWAISQSGNVQANSIAIRDVNTNILIASGLANDGSEAVNIGTIVNTSPISQSWRGEGVNTQLAPFNSSNFTVTSIYPYFYGKVASGGSAPGVNRPTANQALINSGTAVVGISTGTITINFNTTSDDYMWFAIPATSTSKTKWFVNSLNNGNIGGAVAPGGNLFPDPNTLNIDSPTVLWNGISYKIYIANYQSSVVVPMELRNS